MQLGLIEGFYGIPWSMPNRQSTIAALAAHGYQHYLYAPKADHWLSARWRDAPPQAWIDDLREFAAFCDTHNVHLAMGLSPQGAATADLATEKAALQRWVDRIHGLGINDLTLLFDDQHTGGTREAMAILQQQIAITHFIQASAPQLRLTFCPGYYADDPLLDTLFGTRPPNYLKRLGEALDPGIDIYWAGPRIINAVIPSDHLVRVAEQLQRVPVLWDNYPVNDGETLCEHLHLRAFEGRPATSNRLIRRHGINVASQPTLTRIPALTLAMHYAQGSAYQPDAAFQQAAEQVLGVTLANQITEDLPLLQDQGRTHLSSTERQRLRDRYSANPHPACQEIIDWLNGKYQVSNADVAFLGQSS